MPLADYFRHYLLLLLIRHCHYYASLRHYYFFRFSIRITFDAPFDAEADCAPIFSPLLPSTPPDISPARLLIAQPPISAISAFAHALLIAIAIARQLALLPAAIAADTFSIFLRQQMIIISLLLADITPCRHAIISLILSAIRLAFAIFPPQSICCCIDAAGQRHCAPAPLPIIDADIFARRTTPTCFLLLMTLLMLSCRY